MLDTILNLKIKNWKHVAINPEFQDGEWALNASEEGLKTLCARISLGDDSAWVIRRGGWIILKKDGTQVFARPELAEHLATKVPSEYRIKRR